MTKAQHTPGPWAWFGKANCHQLYLATTHSGRGTVMQFRRWGPQGAQPEFQADRRMVPAKDLLTFEVGERGVVGFDAAKANPSVYRYDVDGIDHPDAHLMAAAPELLGALQLLVRQVKCDLGMFPGQPHKESALGIAEAAIAKATGEVA